MKQLLKRIVLEGNFSFRRDQGSHLDQWVNRIKEFGPGHLNELRTNRFIVTEMESGGSRTLEYDRFNEPYRKYLEEILF